MMTSCAPSLANLFKGRFDKNFIDNYHLKLLLWLWFIDDIFHVWTHGKDEFNQFVQSTNSVHTTIKFTCEYSKTAVECLDTRVILHPVTTELHTTLNTKLTDTKDFSPSSVQPTLRAPK